MSQQMTVTGDSPWTWDADPESTEHARQPGTHSPRRGRREPGPTLRKKRHRHWPAGDQCRGGENSWVRSHRAAGSAAGTVGGLLRGRLQARVQVGEAGEGGRWGRQPGEPTWAACLHIQLHSAQPKTERLHDQATVPGGPRTPLGTMGSRRRTISGGGCQPYSH